MGTRADFYAKDGDTVTYLRFGSFDGYHWHEKVDLSAIRTREAFEAMIVATGSPETWAQDGRWPWPWDTSRLTDYVYLFTGEGVEVYVFNHGPVPPFAGDPSASYKHLPVATWFPHKGGLANPDPDTP